MTLSVLEHVRGIQREGKGEGAKLVELPCQLRLAMRAVKRQPAQTLKILIQ